MRCARPVYPRLPPIMQAQITCYELSTLRRASGSQNLSPGSTPDLSDGLANSLGVFAELALGFLLNRQQS